MDAVAFWADIGTLVALILTAIALIFTGQQLLIGRRSASATALISLNESFRQAWLHFLKATEDDARQHAFADVMNLLEISCAVFEDKLFVGRSGKLLENYLCHIFILIRDSDDARQRIEKLLLTPLTFQHVVVYLERHRGQIRGIQLPVAPQIEPENGP